MIHTVLYYNDQMPFGKYKGHRVGEVAKAHPSYIDWWNTNIATFSIDAGGIPFTKKEVPIRYEQCCQGSSMGLGCTC